MPKKKESYIGIVAYKAIPKKDLPKMSESELKAIARTGNKILRSASKSREKAGFPGLKIKSYAGLNKKQLVDLILEQRRKVNDPRRTVAGYKEAAKKGFGTAFKTAFGYDPTIVEGKTGLTIEGVYIPYDKIAKFFRAMHIERDKLLWGEGSVGSAQILTDYINILKGTSVKDFFKKVGERIDKIEEEERAKTLAEASKSKIETVPYIPSGGY